MNARSLATKLAITVAIVVGAILAIQSFQFNAASSDTIQTVESDGMETRITSRSAPKPRKSLSPPRDISDSTTSSRLSREQTQIEREFRIAALKDDVVSTHPELVIEDGETSGRIYFDIYVVNESGIPIPGATVEMNGTYVQEGDGSWYPWPGLKPKETTNKDGIARVSAFQFSFDKFDTAGVSFEVSHPDYTSAACNMNFDKMTKVVLSTGWNLQVVVSDENSSEPLKSGIRMKFHSLFPPEYNQQNNGTLNVRKISVPSLSFYVSYDSPSGDVALSPLKTIEFPRTDDPVPVTVYSTYSINGKLSDNVPRPVKNGKVVALAASGEKSCGRYARREVDINPDGTFYIEGMPEGEILIWALADGWCSVVPGKPSVLGRPQIFQLTKKSQDYTLPMNATATAIMHVVDENGKPVPGQVVTISPNMCYEGCCSYWIRYSEFSTTSTLEGLAVIPDIPPLTKSPFYVMGDYTLPAGEYATDLDEYFDHNVKFDLTPGQILEQTLTVYPKGTAPTLPHGDAVTTSNGEN